MSTTARKHMLSKTIQIIPIKTCRCKSNFSWEKLDHCHSFILSLCLVLWESAFLLCGLPMWQPAKPSGEKPQSHIRVSAQILHLEEAGSQSFLTPTRFTFQRHGEKWSCWGVQVAWGDEIPRPARPAVSQLALRAGSVPWGALWGEGLAFLQLSADHPSPLGIQEPGCIPVHLKIWKIWPEE